MVCRFYGVFGVFSDGRCVGLGRVVDENSSGGQAGKYESSLASFMIQKNGRG
jgi:hypothetical protein